MRVYQADAFAAVPYEGNAAALVVFDSGAEWPSDRQMVFFASEMSLSETAFAKPVGKPTRFVLRWFTPKNEVDLCGHATLAAGALIMAHETPPGTASVTFETASGVLTVEEDSSDRMKFAMQLPRRPPATEKQHTLTAVAHAVGVGEDEVLSLNSARDLIVELSSERAVRSAQPDFSRIMSLPFFAVCVTAPSDYQEHDFVSRFFAPRQGLNEDPVTGSAHCSLAPLWEQKLQKSTLYARQVSQRGGELTCTLGTADAQHVTIAGPVSEIFAGELNSRLFN